MPDISTPNLDYGNMVEAWDINDALMGGTLYMRQLGEHICRAGRKKTKRTTKSASPWPRFCQPTKRPLSKTSGVYSPSPLSLPRMCLISCESMRKLRPGGTRLDVWAQAFFGLAMQYGLSHALVDYPGWTPKR
jgi:hypothetical protein